MLTRAALHRDVKPSNLLIGLDGRARLTDFGVAEDSVLRAAKDPGMYIRTAPPEYLSGGGWSDERSDLRLVGVLAWRMIAGEVPDQEAAHRGRLGLVHRRSPEVPMALPRAVGWALRPDPGDRPASAERLLDAVVRVPVRVGWHDLTPTDPAVDRAWQADDAGRGVVVEVRRVTGGYRSLARAPTGRRLARRRDVRSSTRAAAHAVARSWLTEVVAGRVL